MCKHANDVIKLTFLSQNTFQWSVSTLQGMLATISHSTRLQRVLWWWLQTWVFSVVPEICCY